MDIDLNKTKIADQDLYEVVNGLLADASYVFELLPPPVGDILADQVENVHEMLIEKKMGPQRSMKFDEYNAILPSFIAVLLTDMLGR